MVEVTRIDDFTREEIDFAIDVINKKREDEEKAAKLEIARLAYANFLNTCITLGITPRLTGGKYVPMSTKLSNMNIEFKFE